ncbi:hypothetical protein J6590_093509, partial [Homalodisca vitripennis]
GYDLEDKEKKIRTMRLHRRRNETKQSTRGSKDLKKLLIVDVLIDLSATTIAGVVEGIDEAHLFHSHLDTKLTCPACAEAAETAEYIFFYCQVCEAQRRELQEIVGERLGPANLTETIISSEPNWKAISNFTVIVMKRLK